MHCRALSRVLLVLITCCSARSEVTEEDEFCAPFRSVSLDESKVRRYGNGSLEHDDVLYPVGLHRILGNETRGCVCNVRVCVRKCCRWNEILADSPRPNCTELPRGSRSPDLILKENEMAIKIQGIAAISDVFLLVEDISCPENTGTLVLEPDKYPKDAFVLEANGTLNTFKAFPAGEYCIDWKGSFEKTAVLVCMPREPKEDQSIKAGIIVSIPFLIVTFLIYAIIPELRNIYGKTLMCYVVCLVVAYSFLVVAKLCNLRFACCSTIVLQMMKKRYRFSTTVNGLWSLVVSIVSLVPVARTKTPLDAKTSYNITCER